MFLLYVKKSNMKKLHKILLHFRFEVSKKCTFRRKISFIKTFNFKAGGHYSHCLKKIHRYLFKHNVHANKKYIDICVGVSVVGLINFQSPNTVIFQFLVWV